MKNTRITRRHFVTSSLFTGAVTAMLSGKTLALGLNESAQRLLKEPGAIKYLLKVRLPNVTIEEQSLNSYTVDLMRRIEEERDADSFLYKAVLKSKTNNQQLEHFIVQDFLLKSDALMMAHHKKPITYSA